jgi:hypothetical protein
MDCGMLHNSLIFTSIIPKLPGKPSQGTVAYWSFSWLEHPFLHGDKLHPSQRLAVGNNTHHFGQYSFWKQIRWRVLPVLLLCLTQMLAKNMSNAHPLANMLNVATSTETNNDPEAFRC